MQGVTGNKTASFIVDDDAGDKSRLYQSSDAPDMRSYLRQTRKRQYAV
jgi:hypothetical protein